MDRRDWIVMIILMILIAIGSWEFGYIYRDIRSDRLREDVIKLERIVTSHDGRIVMIEGKKPNPK